MPSTLRSSATNLRALCVKVESALNSKRKRKKHRRRTKRTAHEPVQRFGKTKDRSFHLWLSQIFGHFVLVQGFNAQKIVSENSLLLLHPAYQRCHQAPRIESRSLRSARFLC